MSIRQRTIAGKLRMHNRKNDKRRRQLEIALNEAQKASQAKSEFLSQMSHEIRTPMNTIIGMASIARMAQDNAEKVWECLNNIEISSHHLLMLINDMLDISKIENGKMQLSNGMFSLSLLLEEVRAIVTSQIADKKQHFYIISQELAHDILIGDSLRIKQIIINILSNAIKFTPNQGIIQMFLEEREENNGTILLAVTVKDNGRGMKEEFIKKVFLPFEQEYNHDLAGRNNNGSGLGMAITKSMVLLMGGTIQVSSKEGKGSEFHLSIPFKIGKIGKAVYHKPIQEWKEDCLKEIHILIAEDNLLNMEIAEELLRRSGAKIDKANNGRVAVDKFLQSKEGNYQVILMDIQMPELTGYEASRAIRASNHPDSKKIKIIAMTASVFAEDITAAREAGMNSHIAKPISISSLYQGIIAELEQ